MTTRTRREYEELLKDPRVQAALETIAHAEGTKKAKDPYKTAFNFNSFDSTADHPNKVFKGGKYKSSASGKYQIMKDTWYGTKANGNKGVKAKLGLKDFSQKSQDIAAIYLIDRRGGLDPLLKDDFKGFSKAVRKEWASFPGAGYGQPEKKFSELQKVFNDNVKRHTTFEDLPGFEKGPHPQDIPLGVSRPARNPVGLLTNNDGDLAVPSSRPILASTPVGDEGVVDTFKNPPPLGDGVDIPNSRQPASVNASMSPLLRNSRQASKLTKADAGRRMNGETIAAPYDAMRGFYTKSTGKEFPPINDAIAKKGTSRERDTRGSQHFKGTALDISTDGLSNAEKIALYDAALKSGYSGFGFGRNILHVDRRGFGEGKNERTAWSYENGTFAGQPIHEMKKAAQQGITPGGEELNAALNRETPTPTFRSGLLNDEDRQAIGLPALDDLPLNSGRDVTTPTFRPPEQSELDARRGALQQDFQRSKEQTQRAVRGTGYAPTMTPRQDFPVNELGNHQFDENGEQMFFAKNPPPASPAPHRAISAAFTPSGNSLSEDDIKRTFRQGRYDINQFNTISPMESRRMNAEGYAKDVYQEDRSSGLLNDNDRSQFGLPARASGFAGDNAPRGSGVIPSRSTTPAFRPSPKPQYKTVKGFKNVTREVPINDAGSMSAAQRYAFSSLDGANYKPEPKTRTITERVPYTRQVKIAGPLGDDRRTDAEKMGLYATPQAPYLQNPLDKLTGVNPNASTGKRMWQGAKRGMAFGPVGMGAGALIGALRGGPARQAADRMQWGSNPISNLFNGGNQQQRAPAQNVGGAMNVYNSGSETPVYGTANHSGARVGANEYGRGWTNLTNKHGVTTATIPLAGGGTAQAVVNGGGFFSGLFG